MPIGILMRLLNENTPSIQFNEVMMSLTDEATRNFSLMSPGGIYLFYRSVGALHFIDRLCTCLFKSIHCVFFFSVSRSLYVSPIK